jgi:hypothetical protein
MNALEKRIERERARMPHRKPAQRARPAKKSIPKPKAKPARRKAKR